MNIPSFLMISKRIYLCALVVLTLAVAVSAQKISDIPSPEANPDIDQCANGKRGTPLLPCTGNNWQNGNINENNAQYAEGETVPFRIIYTGLTPGQSYSLSIEWDTTKSGKAAYDYLTTFNRSYPTGNDPCDGVAGCSLATFAATPIPIDPHVTAGFDRDPLTGADNSATDNIVQAPGEFRVYGASSITALSPSDYTLSGSYAGDSTRGITITFIAGAANDGTKTNVVFAWGGHIARRGDWGVNNSAIAISGSPYHMNRAGGANQDRSLKINAVLFPASITIIKEVSTYQQPNSTNDTSNQLFVFNPSDNFSLLDFTLQDNENDADGFSDRIVKEFSVIAPATQVTSIEELIGNVGNGWSVSDITCADTDGGNGLGLSDSVPQAGDWDPIADPAHAATATITLQEAEFVTCTFKNDQATPTAAPASVGGRVTNSIGRGLGGVYITLTDLASGSTTVARTNSFGYYRFNNVDTEAFYSLSVGSKRYSFPVETQYFTLHEDSFDMNFIASN